MRGFLYIYQRKFKGHSPKEIIALVNKLKQTEHTFDYRETEKIKVFQYTNETQIIEDSVLNSNFISLIGQYVGEETYIRESLSKYTGEDLRKFVSELKGAFALAKADLERNEMVFYTHLFRIDNIFYRETENFIIVGTDPLIVSAISNAKTYKPEIDIKNSISFLMNGYFADENTLFKEVKLVPPNSEMMIKDSKIEISDVDNVINEIFTIKPNKDVNEDLKKSYIDSFKAVPKDTVLNIGVTGGKDSRLALLGALESGYKVNANTRGFIDNPDVQIAKLITDKLKIKHKISEPKIAQEKGITVNLEKKVLNAMIATSGQVYGYENISYQPNYKGNVGLTGVAALSMKGGYSNLNNLITNNPETEMLKRFLPLEELLVEGVSDKYKKNLLKLVKDDFQVAQYKHALFYRNGRWTSGTRLAKSYNSDIYSPFYDNYFSKKIIKLQKKFLDNGFVQYTLTNKLNPEISKLPLAGSRWGFESDQPVKPEHYNAWLKREPQYAKTGLSNFNWRNISKSGNDVVRNQFKEILFSNPNHVIFQVIDYQTFKKKFEDGLSNKYMKFSWAALSLFAYINHLDSKPIVGKDINIKIPETIVNRVNKVPKTIDLMGEVFTINDSLSLSKNHDSYSISINENVKKNRYLTIFSSNITSGSNHPLANITGYENIYLNIYIETKEKINFNYCILFFTEKQNIKTHWFKSRIDSQSNNLTASTMIPKDATNFKIAFKIPNELRTSFKIRYFFAKIK